MAIDLEVGEAMVYSLTVQFSFQFRKDFLYFIIRPDVLVIDVFGQMDIPVFEGGLGGRRGEELYSREERFAGFIDPDVDPFVFQVMQFYLGPHLIHEAHAGSRPIPVYGHSGDAVEGQAEVFFDLNIHVIKVNAISGWM